MKPSFRPMALPDVIFTLVTHSYLTSKCSLLEFKNRSVGQILFWFSICSKFLIIHNKLITIYNYWTKLFCYCENWSTSVPLWLCNGYTNIASFCSIELLPILYLKILIMLVFNQDIMNYILNIFSYWIKSG